MRTQDDSDDFQPVTWLWGHPIHAATLIALIYVVTLFATTIAISAGAQEFLFQQLAYSSNAVLRLGRVWQFFTYAIVNPPSFGFVFQALMLWFFGRELEKFFGRQVFTKFYLAVFLLTPLVLTLVGLFTPMATFGVAGGLAVFVAFATLYPLFPLFFGIKARDAAVIVLAIQTLIFIAAHAWGDLVTMWAGALFAYFFVGYERGEWTLPEWRPWKRSPRLHVVPRDVPAREKSFAKSEPVDSIDPLLDKIAAHGIASLTAKERGRLEQARAELLKKESR